jgi:hypothetical protein
MKHNSKIYRLKTNGHHILLGEESDKTKVYVSDFGTVILVKNNQLIVYINGKISKILDCDIPIKCITYNHNKSIAVVSDNKFIQYDFLTTKHFKIVEFDIRIINPVDIVPINTKYQFIILNLEGQLWLVDSLRRSVEEKCVPHTFSPSIRLAYSPLSESYKIIKIRSTDNFQQLLIQKKNLLWSYYNVSTNIASPCYMESAFDISVNCVNGDMLYLV